VEDIMRSPELEEVSATVGRIVVKPNASNIIPGEAILTLDLRTAEVQKKGQALAQLDKAVAEIARRRQIRIERSMNLDQAEMPMDPIIIEALSDAAEANGEKKRNLVSMAGHDAANMARITRAGMIFVQSVDGYSHCPQEYTNEAEIAKAAQVMLNAVLLLDRRLD